MKMEEIQKLIDDGVTLEQIITELEYRDNTGDQYKWDDDLFEYSEEELMEIADELNKRK